MTRVQAAMLWSGLLAALSRHSARSASPAAAGDSELAAARAPSSTTSAPADRRLWIVMRAPRRVPASRHVIVATGHRCNNGALPPRLHFASARSALPWRREGAHG